MQKDDQEEDCDQKEDDRQTHQKNLEEKMIRKKPLPQNICQAPEKRLGDMPAEKLAVSIIASYNKIIPPIILIERLRE